MPDLWGGGSSLRSLLVRFRYGMEWGKSLLQQRIRGGINCYQFTGAPQTTKSKLPQRHQHGRWPLPGSSPGGYYGAHLSPELLGEYSSGTSCRCSPYTATNQIKIRSTAESKSASGLHGWGSSQRGAEADRSGCNTTNIPLHYARRQPIRTSTVGARIGLAYTACGPLLSPFLSSAFRNEIVFVEGEHVLPVDVSYVQ